MEGLHALLRQETAALHSELDALPRLKALLAPDLSLGAYLDVLERMHGIVPPLESALLAKPGYAAHIPRLRDRMRTDVLEGDLAFLSTLLPIPVAQVESGGSQEVSRRRNLASEWHGPVHQRALELLDSPESGLGILYVLEGSTLGGKFIARALQRSLGPLVGSAAVPSGAGVGFFGGRGEDTMPLWKEFVDCLDAVGETWDEAAKSRAAKAAAFVFQRMYAIFSAPDVTKK